MFNGQKKGKFELNNGKLVTVGYGLFSGRNEFILSILGIFCKYLCNPC